MNRALIFTQNKELFGTMQVLLKSGVKPMFRDFSAQGNPASCALVSLCLLLPVRPVDGPFAVVNKCCPETGVTALSKDRVPAFLRLVFWCGEETNSFRWWQVPYRKEDIRRVNNYGKC